MSRHAGALLILIAACGGCTNAPTERPHPTANAAPSTSRGPRSNAVTSTTTTSLRTDPSVVKRRATTTVASVFQADAGQAATAAVEGLLSRRWDANIPDADLWADALSGGSIVQVTILSESGGRADVAVSVAFAEPTSEPTGIRIALRLTDTAWVVDGIGYL